jgi:hypothetical protein
MQKPNRFCVAQRIVPAHGIRVGCEARNVAVGLTRAEANELADKLQAKNPDEEYAITEVVFRRWTKSEGK